MATKPASCKATKPASKTATTEPSKTASEADNAGFETVGDTKSILSEFLDSTTLENIQSGSSSERIELFAKNSTSLFKKYRAAIHQMQARLDILDEDLEYRLNRNPIHHIETRLKNPRSVYEKLERRGKPLTLESIENNITDIAGVRVICSYIDDVYSLEKVLLSQDDLELVRRKDYIENPKPNGYRSLHLIVTVPVYFLDRKQHVPVEIQLRTVAMDMWASLEHTLRYKHKEDVSGIDMFDELKNCSDIIEDVEQRMQILMHAVETNDIDEAARRRRNQIKEQARVAQKLNEQFGNVPTSA